LLTKVNISETLKTCIDIRYLIIFTNWQGNQSHVIYWELSFHFMAEITKSLKLDTFYVHRQSHLETITFRNKQNKQCCTFLFGIKGLFVAHLNMQCFLFCAPYFFVDSPLNGDQNVFNFEVLLVLWWEGEFRKVDSSLHINPASKMFTKTEQGFVVHISLDSFACLEREKMETLL